MQVEHTVVRNVPEPPPCSLPAPNAYGVGSVVECVCGRRWKMRRVGWSFKGWNTTVPTKLQFLFHSRTRNPWADVRK